MRRQQPCLLPGCFSPDALLTSHIMGYLIWSQTFYKRGALLGCV